MWEVMDWRGRSVVGRVRGISSNCRRARPRAIAKRACFRRPTTEREQGAGWLHKLSGQLISRSRTLTVSATCFATRCLSATHLNNHGVFLSQRAMEKRRSDRYRTTHALARRCISKACKVRSHLGAYLGGLACPIYPAFLFLSLHISSDGRATEAKR
jgi:hypothetical protein